MKGLGLGFEWQMGFVDGIRFGSIKRGVKDLIEGTDSSSAH